MHELVKWVHVGAGTVALAALWLPLFAKKGGALHRRVGWVYVAAMAVVAATALAMSAARVIVGVSERERGVVFLGYVALLSAANASMGVRVVRTRARTAALRSPWDVGLAVALVAGGVAMLVWAATLGAMLFGVFGALGAVLGVNQLRFWLQPPVAQGQWLREHLANMVGAGIGTLTAVAVVNARQLGLSSQSLWVWVGPGVIGGCVMAALLRRYRAPSGTASK